MSGGYRDERDEPFQDSGGDNQRGDNEYRDDYRYETTYRDEEPPKRRRRRTKFGTTRLMLLYLLVGTIVFIAFIVAISYIVVMIRGEGSAPSADALIEIVKAIGEVIGEIAQSEDE